MRTVPRPLTTLVQAHLYSLLEFKAAIGDIRCDVPSSRKIYNSAAATARIQLS